MAQPSSTATSLSQKNGEHGNPPVDLSQFHLLHQVLRIRAADPIQVPLLAFPKSLRGAADFEYFTGKDLVRLTDEAACHYSSVITASVCYTKSVLVACSSGIKKKKKFLAYDASAKNEANK